MRSSLQIFGGVGVSGADTCTGTCTGYSNFTEDLQVPAPDTPTPPKICRYLHRILQHHQRFTGTCTGYYFTDDLQLPAPDTPPKICRYLHRYSNSTEDLQVPAPDTPTPPKICKLLMCVRRGIKSAFKGN